MYIYLDFSIEEIRHLPDAEIEVLFSDILRSSRKGNHRFMISRQLATFVGETYNLISVDKAQIERLGELFARGPSIETCRPPFLRISIGELPLERRVDGTFAIGHANIVGSHLLDRCTLLVEDANSDGSLYSVLIHLENRKRQFGGATHTIVHGGGSSLPSTLDRLCEEGRIILTIFDSDKTHPTHPGSKMDREVKKIVLRPISSIVLAKATPGREAENIIPFSLIGRDLFPDSAESIICIERIIAAQGNIDLSECFWNYFDIKGGLKPDSSVFASEDGSAWIRSKLALAGRLSQNDRIAGFGDAFLKRIMDHNQTQSKLHGHIRSSHWTSHMSGWFDEILQLLASASEHRT